jgi:hypothetical protein
MRCYNRRERITPEGLISFRIWEEELKSSGSPQVFLET